MAHETIHKTETDSQTWRTVPVAKAGREWDGIGCYKMQTITFRMDKQ